MSKDHVVILSARRTPIGAFQGAFAGMTAPQLGGVALKAALEDSGVPAKDINDVLMGCVLPAGLGQAPARQAAFLAGIPASVPAVTINKMCGSGMRALMMAADQIGAGSSDIVAAGGLESMTNAPYLLPKARSGMRMGHGEVLDHMFTDGLQSAWDGKLMGCFADATSEKYGFTREAQDAYATESVRRAQAANNSGAFAKETVAVRAKSRKGEVVVDKDESPFTLDVAKIATLKPAFGKNGTVTAASSSSIADGASALIMTRESTAKQRNLKPVARLLGHASFAREPEWFTLAPAGAIQLALKQAGWSTKEVDLYEINEAFAAVTMAAMKDLSLDHATVNVNGGACALGHPVGATGARITTTLIHALAARGLKRGVAALCIGGGEATAIALELI
jgi:acetyl-CoA C-acetyltransferase